MIGTLVVAAFPLGVELASFGTALWAAVSFLFIWMITVILFGLAAWLIQGFRLKNGLISAICGAVVYSVISAMVLRALGLADVDFTRAALIGSFA